MLNNCLFQVIVICVGTNNHTHSAEQVVGGIMAIVETLHEKQPQAQIIVMVSGEKRAFYAFYTAQSISFELNIFE